MPIGTISQVASVAGLSIQSTVTRTEAGQIGHEVSLPAAKAGTLSTRTDANDGELTLGAAHGIEDDDVIDIFWIDADGVGQCAYGAVVGVVAGAAVPFTGAAGTALPIEDYAITASVVVVIDTDVDGDLIEIVVACATLLSHVAFRDATPTVLKAVTLPAAESWTWVSRQGITNPLTGNPVNDIRASNGDVTAASTLKIGVLYDSA